jgi:acyl carrier protein
MALSAEAPSIETLVLEVLRDYLAGREQEAALATELTGASNLLGQSAVVDSAGFVTVLVEVETRLREKYGAEITLADERAFSQGRSPFRTVAALADYASVLLRESVAIERS